LPVAAAKVPGAGDVGGRSTLGSAGRAVGTGAKRTVALGRAVEGGSRAVVTGALGEAKMVASCCNAW
jgi:hypothetical protein